MPFVLDASVTASWFFPDENHSVSAEAWGRFRTDNALVPGHWWFEVRNSMLVAERRSRLTELLTSNALARLSHLRIRQVANPDDGAVFLLARRHRLTFYDAAYLELAQRENLPLATLDGALTRAARAEGVMLFEAS